MSGLKGGHRQLSMEDQEVLKAIANGDRAVFEIFYKKYYAPLFAVASRYLGQAEVAEEVVHDVFIMIWNKADQLDLKYSMKSYLFRSVVNAALNVLKKQKSEAEKHNVFLHTTFDERQNPEMGAPARESEDAMLEAMEQALGLLPEKCKQVMYLSRFGKLKQQEIAEQMNISVKTVKNHLTYGFQKLRTHLEKHKQTATIFILLFMITFFKH